MTRAHVGIAVAMAAVCGLLGSPTGVGASASSPANAAQATPLVWWALGDSYSSGEGIPGTEPPQAGAKDCSRASGVNTGAKAWGVVAREKLAEPRIKSWAFVPCTGATSNDIAGQIGEAKTASKADKADIVTLSMGGNDIGFAEVIEGCIDAKTVWVFQDIGCDVAESTLRSRIEMLVGNRDPVAGEYSGVTLPAMYDLIATKVRTGGAVVVLGYPQLVEEVARWDGWRRDFSPNCEGVQSDDVAMLRSVAGYLNQQIALAVQAADKRWSGKGVRFIWRDIATGVYEKGDAVDQRHGLCGQNPWINGITTGWRSGDAQHERSFHPKQEGHTATGEWLARWMRTNLKLESMNAPKKPTPKPPAAKKVVPDLSAEVFSNYEYARDSTLAYMTQAELDAKVRDLKAKTGLEWTVEAMIALGSSACRGEWEADPNAPDDAYDFSDKGYRDWANAVAGPLGITSGQVLAALRPRHWGWDGLPGVMCG